MVTSVLVVEDDIDLRESLEEVLEHEGFEVRTASCGVSALSALAEADRPDLLVLDLMLPGMDGFQLRRAMQADPSLRHIPVIVATAVPQPNRMHDALQASAYLEKPFDLETLFTLARSLTERPSATPLEGRWRCVRLAPYSD